MRPLDITYTRGERGRPRDRETRRRARIGFPPRFVTFCKGSRLALPGRRARAVTRDCRRVSSRARVYSRSATCQSKQLSRRLSRVIENISKLFCISLLVCRPRSKAPAAPFFAGYSGGLGIPIAEYENRCGGDTRFKFRPHRGRCSRATRSAAESRARPGYIKPLPASGTGGRPIFDIFKLPLLFLEY